MTFLYVVAAVVVSLALLDLADSLTRWRAVKKALRKDTKK